jgi:hypothetical protein
MEHCVAKIREIANRPVGDYASIFQLGYNLGRLSELTGLGRGPFWDAWHKAVVAWDCAALQQLARDLPPLNPTPLDTSEMSDPGTPKNGI